MLSLSDLLATLERDQVIAALLQIASDVGLKVTAWQPGQPIRTWLAVVAQKISDDTKTKREAIAGGLLDFATGGWLTLLAYSVYNVIRVEARFATGTITLTNAGGSSVPVAIGDVIIAHAVTGKTYRNTVAGTIPAGGTLDLTILAEEAGTDSDAAPGALTVLVSSIVDVTCTNAEAVLGADEETDAALRLRCREKLGSLSPDGPKEAYSYAAKTLSETTTPITRTKVTASTTTGLVTVYAATASGAPTGPDLAIVQTAIDTWAEPLCVEATAVAATEHTIAITYEAWVEGSTLSPVQIQAAIATALATYFADLPIGGYVIPPATVGKVDVDALKGVIFRAVEGVVDVAISLPASDEAIATGEVPKLGAISATVTVL
jgi:phage-related baseplate assembly protein